MSLIGDHFATCDRCNRYVITGTHRYMMRNSPHLCRCVTEDNTSSQRVSEIAKSEQVRRKLTISTKRRAA